MALKEGNIVEGKVINITNFGAFVEVEGKTGLVHISEIADTFVKDIRQHLKEEDIVKVKVMSIDDNGKLSLSIRQAMIKRKSARPADIDWNNERKKQQDCSFEDRISKFLKESEERAQDIKRHQEHRGKNNKKRS